MIVKRKMFSGKKESKKKETAMAVGVGAGIAVGTDKTATKSARHLAGKLMKSELKAHDAEDIKRKLIKGAKNQGIKIVEDESTTNAAYVGSKMGKRLRNGIAALTKKVKKSQGSGKDKEFLNQINQGLKQNLPSKKMWNNLGKDAIVIGKKGTLSDADVLSHEIGHAQYMKSGRSKSLIGKASHKLMTGSKLATTKIGASASAVHGFKSGVKSEKLKKEGKKENTWNKVKSVAVPAIITAPLLIAEGKASTNGLKNMKKLGASKQLLKESRKRLGNAWGTYASAAASPIIAGEAGRVAGKIYEKQRNKKDRDQ